jgi:hypothetical protein
MSPTSAGAGGDSTGSRKHLWKLAAMIELAANNREQALVTDVSVAALLYMCMYQRLPLSQNNAR